MEKIITIPKELVKRGELIIIPRGEYEEYLRIKKNIPIIRANIHEKKAIKEGKREIKSGRYFTIKQLRDEMEC